MSDRSYVLVWADGHTEKVYGEIRIRDNCLEITEHFGITFGVKSQRVIPLVQIREWRTAE